MSLAKEDIDQIKQEFKTALTSVQNVKELEQVRIAFLGKSGKIQALFQQLKTCSVEEKKIVGPLLNKLKQDIEELIAIASKRNGFC